jgi:hypothetical protein
MMKDRGGEATKATANCGCNLQDALHIGLNPDRSDLTGAASGETDRHQ